LRVLDASLSCGVARKSGAASFEDQLKGSIEPSKLADLVVLGRDPLPEALFSLIKLRIERAMVGGAQFDWPDRKQFVSSRVGLTKTATLTLDFSEV